MAKGATWTAIALSAALFACGAQTAVAQTTHPGSERAAQLTTDIRQRESNELRLKAWARIRSMLRGDEVEQVDALATIARTSDIRIDRSGLEAELLPLLSSKNADVRRAVLTALPTMKPDPKCLEAVSALAKDPDPKVRATVMSAFVFIRGSAGLYTPITEPALTLLADSEKEVVVETARSLWGVPVSADVEAKVIELSRFPDGDVPGYKSVPYWMNYFVLSTRPQLSRPVAERLAEIAGHPKLDQNWTGRAVWGLARPASAEAADVVTKALVEELDHSLTPYNREWAVRGLARLQTGAAKDKLAEVAADADESDELRKLARELSERR